MQKNVNHNTELLLCRPQRAEKLRCLVLKLQLVIRGRVQETTGLTSCLHLQKRCDGLDLSRSGEGGSSARPEGERSQWGSSASGGRGGATQPGKSADPAASYINLVAQQIKKTQLANAEVDLALHKESKHGLLAGPATVSVKHGSTATQISPLTTVKLNTVWLWEALVMLTCCLST